MSKTKFDIKLYNRYNNNIGLKALPNNEYAFIGNYDFLRIIYDDIILTANSTIHAIDPDGGPFMGVGDFTIKNDSLILDKIEYNDEPDENASEIKKRYNYILCFKDNIVEENTTE